MKKFRLDLFRSRLKNSQGFTVTEIVVTAVVLLGAIITMVSVFDMAVKMLVTTNVRTLATMIANQEIETIRNLDYEKVNNDIPAQWPNDPNLIVDNFPTEPARYIDVDDNNQVTTYTLETTVTGSIKMEEQIQRKNFNYTVRRYVALVPAEATSAATAYYKRIIVKVSWEEAPVSEIIARTNIAKEDNSQPTPTVKILGIKSSFYNIYTNQTYDETQGMGDYVRGSVTAFATARHNSAKATGIKSVTFSLYRPDGSFATSTTASFVNNLYQYSFSTTPTYADGYGYVLKAEATDDSSDALTDSTSIKFGIDNTPPNVSLLNVKVVDVPGSAKRAKLLIWGATDNLDIYKYLIWRKDPNQVIKQIAAVAPNTGTDTVTFIDAGLAPKTSYIYRVYVVDKAGNMGASGDRDRERLDNSQVDFDSPAAPTGITTDTVSWRTNNLWWARGIDTDTAGYHIYSSKDGTNYTIVGQVNLSGNSTETFQDVDLRENTWYWYFLRSYDNEGNYSVASTVVKILTPVR